MRFPVDEIWVDEDAEEEPLTKRILQAFPHVSVARGAQMQQRLRSVTLSADPFARGKRILRLMRNKGAFVKPCPGTPEYICCGLQIIHTGQGCPMDCRYCALQAYFNRPVLEVFVNADDMVQELAQVLSSRPDTFHRLCTGEFTDSLALDPFTGLAGRLGPVVHKHRNASLELKTKSDHVDHLLDMPPTRRIIFSFSLNARSTAQSEELRAASLSRRLAAAGKAEAKGFRVGFHFDPVIPVPGWEEGYKETINRIYSSVDARSVAWISLGVIRFVPALKDVVRERFGAVPYFHDGFIRGLDGKQRLSVGRRIEMYRALSEHIRRHSPDARIYLCMESPTVWREGLGVSMESSTALAAYLDEAVKDSQSIDDQN